MNTIGSNLFQSIKEMAIASHNNRALFIHSSNIEGKLFNLIWLTLGIILDVIILTLLTLLFVLLLIINIQVNNKSFKLICLFFLMLGNFIMLACACIAIYFVIVWLYTFVLYSVSI